MRSYEQLGPPNIQRWGEKYDDQTMRWAFNRVCGFTDCVVNQPDSSAWAEANLIPLTERVEGVDVSDNEHTTPAKYEDDHGTWGTPMIFPPVYIVRCPKCRKLSWMHSGEDIEKTSNQAKQFQESKKT